MKNNGAYQQPLETSPVARMARAAGIVLLLNLLSRLLGFVRDASIAAVFGAGAATDAYLVAYTIPYFLETILGMAFVTVMVPVVTTYLVKGERRQGWAVASAVGNWTVLLTLVLAVAGIGLAPWLVKALAPGFTGQDYSLAVKLTRIMFLSLPFMATGMLVSGILNAGYIFTSPALAPATSNIIIIAIVLLGGARYGVTGLAVGTVFGFIGFLLIQLPDLPRLQFSYQRQFMPHHPAVRQIGRHLLPVCFSLAVVQLYLATNRVFASQLLPGSITALDFGNRLVAVPLGVFVASVTTAIFPALAEQAARDNHEEMARLIDRGLGLVTLMILPAAVGLIVLRQPLVQLIFQRGAFDAQATAMTSTAVLYFCFGLLAQAMHPIFTRTFYALQDVSVPVITGLISVVLNIIGSYILAPRLGHGGLALANSLAITLYTLMLYLTLKRRLPQIKGTALLAVVAKVGLIALVMGLLVWFAGQTLAVFAWQGSPLGLLLRTGVLVAAGVLVFAGLGLCLGLEEIKIIRGLFLKRLQRGH
ncbi:MAG: murein biosynthesis integral membrane protein MurJ [Clostridia bacterium]|nr:murein biosynthesis integral membrane protein MurJ [Clostridia bacterium]